MVEKNPQAGQWRRTRWLKTRLETLVLLPDYGKATAKQWMNILFGETVVGVIFLIWWALTNPKNPPLVLIFVVAVIVAGYFVWRADHLRLIAQFEIHEWCIQSTPTTSQTGQITGSSIWIQLLPKCLTEAEVHNCQGHLQHVCKWSNAEGWMETELNEPLPLGWSLLTKVILRSRCTPE